MPASNSILQVRGHLRHIRWRGIMLAQLRRCHGRRVVSIGMRIEVVRLPVVINGLPSSKPVICPHDISYRWGRRSCAKSRR
jgi:hypothetical protein